MKDNQKTMGKKEEEKVEVFKNALRAGRDGGNKGEETLRGRNKRETKIKI